MEFTFAALRTEDVDVEVAGGGLMQLVAQMGQKSNTI